MEQLTSTERNMISGLMFWGKGIIVTNGGVTLSQGNTLTVDTHDPAAQIVEDYLKLKLFEKFDFILFPKSLNTYDSVLHTLKKAHNDLDINGRIIVVEKNGGKWAWQEFEGILWMMRDYYIVEQKFLPEQDMGFIFVLRKKEAIDVSKVPEQNSGGSK